MTTATAPRTTYQPTITEVLPTTKEQRRLAAQNFRGFWVEAKSQQMRKGVRIIRYLLTVMPSGYIKCPCEHSKYSRSDCCHKTALRAHLLVEKLAEPMYQNAAPWEVERYKNHPDTIEFARQVAEQQAEAVAAQAERLTCSSCGKSVPDRGQLREGGYVCEACKRTAMTPQARRETAILDTTPAFNGIFVCTR